MLLELRASAGDYSWFSFVFLFYFWQVFNGKPRFKFGSTFKNKHETVICYSFHDWSFILQIPKKYLSRILAFIYLFVSVSLSIRYIFHARKRLCLGQSYRVNCQRIINYYVFSSDNLCVNSWISIKKGSCYQWWKLKEVITGEYDSDIESCIFPHGKFSKIFSGMWKFYKH